MIPKSRELAILDVMDSSDNLGLLKEMGQAFNSLELRSADFEGRVELVRRTDSSGWTATLGIRRQRGSIMKLFPLRLRSGYPWVGFSSSQPAHWVPSPWVGIKSIK